MTKDEEATIRNLIARLSEPNCGGVSAPIYGGMPDMPKDFEPVSRIYINTWLIGALECLLPGPDRDPKLARQLSAR